MGCYFSEIGVSVYVIVFLQVKFQEKTFIQYEKFQIVQN